MCIDWETSHQKLPLLQLPGCGTMVLKIHIMQTFKVISSNPNSKEGFVTKLSCLTKVNHPIFGEKTKSETYYISGTKQVTVPEVQLNIGDFRVAEYPFVPDITTGEVINLKWLHIK